MPGKSRHSKKKQHFHQSRRSRAIQRSESAPPQPTATDTLRPVAAASAPSVKAAHPPQTRPSPVQEYPYIITELRTIGILAGIILVILIVLVLTLS